MRNIERENKLCTTPSTINTINDRKVFNSTRCLVHMQARYQPGQNAQAGAEDREDDYQ
jgi:hypothetical protein